MQRHLHRAEQQTSPCNLTKYCACHEKWLSWVIVVTYETPLFTMRGATDHPATSPNTAPATKSECHEWSSSHMKRHLQRAEQQRHPPTSPNTACHEKWLSWLILVTYETLFTMRGATDVTLQYHRILRLPAETSFTMRDRSEHDPTMIRALTVTPAIPFQISRNAAPAMKGDSWTSPNTAPATKHDGHDWSIIVTYETLFIEGHPNT